MNPVVMVDVDGTISAQPHLVCALMCALKAEGWHVSIVSGSDPDSPSGPTWQSKCNYLQSVGVTECWDDLTVVSGDVPAVKAQWCKDHAVSIMIDNDKDNAKAAMSVVPLVLVPWATRKPQKGSP